MALYAPRYLLDLYIYDLQLRIDQFPSIYTEAMNNKITQRAQTTTKLITILPWFAISRVSMVIHIIPNVQSIVPYIIAKLSLKFPQNPLIICCVMARHPIGQSAWWSRSWSPPKFNHLFLLPPQTIPYNFITIHLYVLSNVANRPTNRKSHRQTNATKNIISLAKMTIYLHVKFQMFIYVQNRS